MRTLTMAGTKFVRIIGDSTEGFQNYTNLSGKVGSSNLSTLSPNDLKNKPLSLHLGASPDVAP